MPVEPGMSNHPPDGCIEWFESSLQNEKTRIPPEGEFVFWHIREDSNLRPAA